jgi:hypothetical protein
MALSNKYELEIIIPTTYEQEDRAEFPLPEVPLSTSMVLASFGVRNPNLNDTTGQYYPSILGVISAAAEITLESDGEPIDGTPPNFLSYWAAIQNLRTTNTAAEDISRQELHNATNLTTNRAGAYTIQAARKDYLNTVTNGTQRLNNQIQISSTTTGNAGSVRLSDLLGILDSIPVLPPLMNAKIVVYFNTRANGYYADNSGAAAVAKTFFGLRPRLLVERVVGPVKFPPKITFFKNVCERVHVEAVANNVAQEVSTRCDGFTNKYLKDVIVFNRVATDSSWMLGVQRSPAMHQERLQVTINGLDYLPNSGITNEAEKMAYFTSTFGPLNLPLASALPGISDSSGQVFDAGTEPLVGNFSITGFAVNQVIQEFLPRINRVGDSTSADRVGAYDVLFFGRVAQSVERISTDPVLKY